MPYSKTTFHDYDIICSWDVLAIEEIKRKENSAVCEEFQNQLWQKPQGWCQTHLLWEDGHPHLSSNKSGDLERLSNLMRNLSQNKQFEAFIFIREQWYSRIVEKVDENSVCQEKEYYMSHKTVARDTAGELGVLPWRTSYGIFLKDSGSGLYYSVEISRKLSYKSEQGKLKETHLGSLGWKLDSKKIYRFQDLLCWFLASHNLSLF